MKKESLNMIAQIEEKATDPYDRVGVAAIYLALKMDDESSAALEKAFEGGALEPDFQYAYYPWFKGLWSNERFRSSQKIRYT